MSDVIGTEIPSFQGRVITGGDADYDEARKIWNGGIDHRPAVIAQCRRAEDVVAALSYARARGLDVSVRGGGHNFGGNAVWPESLVVDLRPGTLRGCVLEWDHERAEAHGPEWRSITEMLEQIATALEDRSKVRHSRPDTTTDGRLDWRTS